MLRTSSRTLAAALALACVSSAHAAAKHAPQQTPWELAEQARTTLAGIPEASRTRDDYTVVMDAYRTIYHSDPSDLKSPDAILAVADLLADEGRILHSEKDLRNAIGQYEFLRKQYPQSSLRITALYNEAQVAGNDLHDNKLAQERYALYLDKYQRAPHREDVQAALTAIKNGTATPLPTTKKPVDQAATETASVPSIPVAVPVTIPQADTPDTTQHTAPAHKGKLATVTGIRHWSTPDYTRVAIDLGDDIQYEAASVANPDRIYFDLHGTRLAQELVGKAFTVTDDGILKKIRAAQFSNDMTRVVLDLKGVTDYSAFLLPNPYRLIIDIHDGKSAHTTAPATTTPTPTATTNTNTGSSLPSMPTADAKPAPPVATVPSTVATVPTHQSAQREAQRDLAAVSQGQDHTSATAAPTSQPIAQVVTPSLSNASFTTTPDNPATKRKGTRGKNDLTPVHIAEPTADGQRSLVRALGLKIGRIVIDAGHGGHDSGTLGVDGIMEKDVVLDVALRLGHLLQQNLGAEIIYTRSDDTFIPLETRTAIANKAQADLFISIHANSSVDATARGVEVYYLNFTSQPDALDVAARENAVSNQGIYQLSDLVKKITLKDKIDESREFAADVDDALYKGLQANNGQLRNRGVKKAPFVVLIGANMPSILAEISFVTNPRDAQQLRTPEYRERVAESLYRGVARYESGLSGMKIAQSKTTSDSNKQ